MAYWLLKTEPTAFSVEDLERRPNKTTGWDGVRNYQARNMLRDQMKIGDQVFLYYSNCDEPGIVAIAEVVEEGYPDVTAFDRKHHHYDPKSDPEKPTWFQVDVQLQRRLRRIITLQELRQHASKKLNDMPLLRTGNRLSVTPVSAAHWKFICSLERAGGGTRSPGRRGSHD
jgi:predicted RNA-binding protein with PUA-like domain